MKARRSEIEGLVNLLMYSFRNGKNLPFTIPTKTCPDLKPSKNYKRKPCRKKHSEIVVQSYLPEKNLYSCIYYGMHDSKNTDQFDQEESIIKMIIKRSLKKKKYGGKTLLEIRKIKTIVSKNDVERTKLIAFRVSEKEWKSIDAKARKRSLEKSDYIRMKLFS